MAGILTGLVARYLIKNLFRGDGNFTDFGA